MKRDVMKSPRARAAVRLALDEDLASVEKVKSSPWCDATSVALVDPKAVADFKGGKEKALMALFGKCMKQLKGNCDPQVLRQILIDEINKA